MRCLSCWTVALAIATSTIVPSFSPCAAFVVTSDPVKPMDPTEHNRVLEQSYSVGQPSFMDSLLSSETLQTLTISIPGRVFVSYSDAFSSVGLGAARVKFSGNSDDIFKYVEVVSTAPNTMEVRKRTDVHDVHLRDAFMLTEITLAQSHQLSQLITSGSADVIVEDRVLVTKNPHVALKMELHGSGNVFIDTSSTSTSSSTSSSPAEQLQRVAIKSSGSGDLHWRMGALQTQGFSLQIAGSGDVTLMGSSLDTTAIDVAIAGSGDICADAPRIQTYSLSTATVGSGTISFTAASGQCNHEDISILGAGDVYLGAIQCQDVKVTVAGAGDIYVQAVHSIVGTAWGAGSVKFVGVTPNLISDRYDSSVFSTTQKKKYHPIAKLKNKNRATTCRIDAFPLRVAVHVSSSFWDRSVGNASAVLGPLVFFALLSLCYLRRQMKPERRGRSERRDLPPRYGSTYDPAQQPKELQPLTQQQQYHQQQAQPQAQVYV